VDIEELYKCGGYITSVRSGLGFTGGIKNPFVDYVDYFYKT